MKKVVTIIVAAIVLALSVTPVLASISPSGSNDMVIRVHNTKGGTGSYTTKKDKDGKHATIIAKPKKGYTFDHWVIQGKYELEEGDLNDPELTFLMKSDIDATPYFKPNKGPTSSIHISYDSGAESPKTGGTVDSGNPPSRTSPYMTFALVILFVILIAGAGIKVAFSKR